MRRLILSCICMMFAGCGLDETLHRSDQPLSLATARTNEWVSSVPFPASTTDIFYLFHAGGMQEHQFLVRFTVASNELDTAVAALLADHDKATRETNRYSSASLPSALAMPEFPQFAPMPWWNPGAITNGYQRHCVTGQPFDLWADATWHTIYLCETD